MPFAQQKPVACAKGNLNLEYFLSLLQFFRRAICRNSTVQLRHIWLLQRPEAVASYTENARGVNLLNYLLYL